MREFNICAGNQVTFHPSRPQPGAISGVVLATKSTVGVKSGTCWGRNSAPGRIWWDAAPAGKGPVGVCGPRPVFLVGGKAFRIGTGLIIERRLRLFLSCSLICLISSPLGSARFFSSPHLSILLDLPSSPSIAPRPQRWTNRAKPEQKYKEKAAPGLFTGEMKLQGSY